MPPLFETVTDLRAGTEVLRRRRYGVIEMSDEQLAAIHLRPFPKIITLPGVWWFGGRTHRSERGNRCWLYYNQPVGFSNFLALRYVVSNRGTTLKTFRGSLLVLDEIARLKRTDAILCEAGNLRISDRLLSRWGWEPHFQRSRRRHYIKRFYGQYAEPQAVCAVSM